MNKKHKTNRKIADKKGQIRAKTRIDGTISITRRGVGFVADENNEQDIRIESEDLGLSLNGDCVRIALLPKRRADELRGEVLEVLLRSKIEYVGIIKKEADTYFLVPQDIKMHRDIIIPQEKLSGAKEGEKALARILISEWKNPKHEPQGEIVQVIGTPGDNNVEMNSIVLDKGFQPCLPAHVEKQAQKIKNESSKYFMEESAIRRDMRKVPTFTIDPEDAKDFDDALSVSKLPDGSLEIGVHIADVSFYVKPDTPIDKEAERRGTSVYLVDRTIPMLPEVLSNDLCSLRPDEDRLAFSAIFTFAPQKGRRDIVPEIKKQWFGKTIIRSKKRFSYADAQEVLDKNTGDYKDELVILNDIAKRFRKKRHTEGAILFDTEEVKFDLDKNGRPLGVYRKKMLDTNHLIEEFMLLANKRVAEFVSKELKRRDIKLFVYRIHERPDEEKVQNLVTFLSGLGYELPISKDGSILAQDVNALLETATDKAEKNVVQTATIRAMAKAIYSIKNIGHYGLGFEHYTHFTSPIRRYPDLMVHRLLLQYLKGKSLSKKELKEYQSLALYASQMEKIASEAERASIKYKQVEYMADRIDEEFDGIISGVADWGIFVEEKETRAEGLIRLRDIGDDYYLYDKDNMRIVGESTKKSYRLGDAVRVRVRNVDMESRQIDYELIKNKKRV